MPQTETLKVIGYTEFMRACARGEKDTKKYTRDVLRATGDAVKTDAAGRFAKYDAKSAAGYRTYVRQRGVSVEQSIRKTTGLRPNFGVLQMRRALIPALIEKEPETEKAMEHALDMIEIRFETGP